MANVIYPKFLQRLLDPNGASGSGVDLNSDTIKICLRDASTVYDSTDEFLSDLAGSTIGSAVTVTSPTVTNGVFDCADPTFSAVASGSTVAAYVVYKDTGTATTSNLIAFFDQDASGNDLSIGTTGGDITISVNASGVFSL